MGVIGLMRQIVHSLLPNGKKNDGRKLYRELLTGPLQERFCIYSPFQKGGTIVSLRTLTALLHWFIPLGDGARRNCSTKKPTVVFRGFYCIIEVNQNYCQDGNLYPGMIV